MPLPKQRQKYSYADYLLWNEDERWEILDGVPYMQAAPYKQIFLRAFMLGADNYKH